MALKLATTMLNAENKNKSSMPVVIEWLNSCARGFNNGLAAILISLYELVMMIFVHSGLRQACSLELLGLETLQNKMKAVFAGYNLVCPHKILFC